jgi:hypothetical protein
MARGTRSKVSDPWPATEAALVAIWSRWFRWSSGSAAPTRRRALPSLLAAYLDLVAGRPDLTEGAFAELVPPEELRWRDGRLEFYRQGNGGAASAWFVSRADADDPDPPVGVHTPWAAQLGLPAAASSGHRLGECLVHLLRLRLCAKFPPKASIARHWGHWWEPTDPDAGRARVLKGLPVVAAIRTDACEGPASRCILLADEETIVRVERHERQTNFCATALTDRAWERLTGGTSMDEDYTRGPRGAWRSAR